MKTFKVENARETYFETKEEYMDFVNTWSKNHKGRTAHEHFLYLAFRGRDIGKQFTPISRYKIPSKGEHEYISLYSVYEDLTRRFDEKSIWKPEMRQAYIDRFGGSLTDENFRSILKSIPHPRDWNEINIDK